MPDLYWKIQKKWPKRIFLALLFLAVLYFISILFTHDYTDRARVAEVLLSASQARERISDILMSNSGAVVNLDAADLIPPVIDTKTKDGKVIEIAFREITSDGSIRVFSPQLGVLLIFKPAIESGEIKWSCWGRPQNIVPAMCR